MKEIRETKMVEQTTVTWVSEDGRTFETERECAFHEKTLNGVRLEADYKKHVLVELNPPMMDFCCSSVTWDIVKMENKSDYLDVIDYWTWALGNFGDMELDEPESYPAIKLLATDECWAGWNYERPEYRAEAIRECQKTLDALIKYFGAPSEAEAAE